MAVIADDNSDQLKAQAVDLIRAKSAPLLVARSHQAIIDFDRAPADHGRAFVVFVGLRPKGR